MCHFAVSFSKTLLRNRSAVFFLVAAALSSATPISLRAQTDDAQTLLELGYGLELQGKLDEAKDAFEAARRLDPKFDAQPN